MTAHVSDEVDEGNDGIANVGSFILLFALVLVSALNLAFHFAVSRRLDTASYGALGALLGILLVLSVPASALQVSITREVASRRGPAGTLIPVDLRPLLSQAVIWGAAASGAMVLAAPLIQRALHLASAGPALLVAAFVVPTAVGLVPKAVLLAEFRYWRVSLAVVLGAVVRLGMGLALTNRGVDGPMAASVISEICVAGVLLPALRPFMHPHGNDPIHVRGADVVTPIVSFMGYWSLGGIDAVLARRLLLPSVSGLYVAATTISRAAMFLPASIATVAFPRFITSATTRRPTQRVPFVQATVAVAAVGLAVAVTLTLFSTQVVTVLFGERYRPAAAIVGLLAAASGCMGLVNVLMHFHLANRRRQVPASSWVGVILAIVLAWLLPHTPSGLAAAMIGATAVVVILLFVPAFSLPRVQHLPGEAFIPHADLDLTVVVPYYNPGPRLRRNLLHICETLESAGSSFEIIAVSDGSTDGSEGLIADLLGDRIRSIALPKNAGKGEALRAGLREGRGRHLGFIDADGDVDPSVLRDFQVLVGLYDPDIVLASKRHPLSQVAYPLVRRVYSWGYHFLIRLLFRLRVRDTQTGAKLIRRDVLAAVLPRMVEKRFAFDLELLVVARRAGYSRFLEVPVRIQHQFTSTISWRSVYGMLLDTLAIIYRLRILRYYDFSRSDAATGDMRP